MIRNKWMWVSLLVCACIAGALAVRPNATKSEQGALQHTLTSSGVELLSIGEQTPAMTRSDSETRVQRGTFTFSAVTEQLRARLAASRSVTEADKQAALQARALLDREPRNPSLDQGSDNCAGVPDLGSALGVAVAVGTTVGFTNNIDTTGWNNIIPACWQGPAFLSSLAGPDVFYKWTAPATGDYTFSLCQGSVNGNQYDTGISLWNFTCPTAPVYPADFICGNDDGGVCVDNFGSELTCLPLTVGQEILIVIDGYDVDAGPYSLDITECTPCVLPACGPGTDPEGEPNCGPDYVDITNGGCNSSPAVYQNIACGDTICGKSGTFTTVDGDSRDTDWFRLVLTDTTRITYSFVAEFDVLNFIIFPGDVGEECDSLTLSDAFTAAPCETLTVTGCLPQGEYWIFIAPATFTGVECGADYKLWLDCEPCEIGGCTAGTITVNCPAGATFNGNTLGAGNDCWVTGAPNQADSLSEDEIWEIIIPAAGLYTFTLCGTDPSWDSYIFLTTGCCEGSIINQNDDGCDNGAVGVNSQITCVQLAAGTYYLWVEGWSVADAAAYTVSITCCAPCEVTCNDSETEVDCADGFTGTNDGCNMAVPSFQNITCGTAICGSSGNYARNDSAFRDLDWYSISVTDTTRISWTWNAEFNARGWILTSNCGSLATLATDTTASCSTKTISACVPQGTYLLVVGPTVFSGLACGLQYNVSVACEACVIPPTVTECPEGSIYSQPVDIPGEAPSLTVALADSSNLGIFQRWDKFVIPGGADICDLHWWGVHLGFNGAFINCETEDPMSFRIRFYPDSTNNRPRVSHVAQFNVTLNRTPMGVTYSLTGPPQPAQGYYYSTDFDTCVTLDSGWVSIQATSAATPNCLFYWITSGGSTGGQSWLKNGANPIQTQAFNLSHCLTTRIPCDPVTNLTVYNAPGNAAAWLNFTAPQAAIYQIFSTTVLTADDNPDGGADPNYVLEASVFFPAGTAQYTLPAGFSTFKKFVVVANCSN